MKNSVSAVGRLIIVLSLALTFVIGMFGVVYLQLKGEEVSIPKIVGKNFNDGRDDLADMGLRIKKIASRYSNEEPNTILEQRPRAGSTAKSGLMISVVVSEKNPDGSEAPVDVKDDEQGIKDIQDQPELKIDKQKPKAKSKKTSPKTRDVVTTKPDSDGSSDSGDSPSSGGDKGTGGDTKPPAQPGDSKSPPTAPKPANDKNDPKKPKSNGDLRSRTVPKDNQ